MSKKRRHYPLVVGRFGQMFFLAAVRGMPVEIHCNKEEIMQKIPKVLFLSRGTCTRSQMAEGFLRALAGSQFQVSSAGIDAGELHPMAIEVMYEAGVDISGQKPKTVAESLREQFRYVIIVYDSAKERSPIFPFTPHLLRWTVADPTAAEGSPAEQKEIFRRVRDDLRKKVETFFSEMSPKPKEEVPIAA